MDASSYCSNCGAANARLASRCFACGEPLPVAFDEHDELLSVGQMVKQRYRIVDLAGKGGFGAVYKAEDSEFDDRLVAVKEMNPRHLSTQERAEAVEAFRQEAHLLAKLTHPNLPRIYDYFSENGRSYLVMDFMEGELLEQYIAEQQGSALRPRDVLEIGLSLCNVLGYLHSRQPPIIFRDLKPANIIRTADGQLYLIDFGIARHFKPGQARDTTALGSPGYAAPEQYGKAQTTPRSDIYSLGVLLHTLLSGNDPTLTPFHFPALRLQGHPALVRLEGLIMQMLEVDANRRPASIAAVKQELQSIDDLLMQPQAMQPQPIPIVPPLPGPGYSPAAIYPQTLRSFYPGTTLYQCEGKLGVINSVAWSPDDTRIAGACGNGLIQVWDATNGRALIHYPVHRDTALSVAWSPDNARLASGSFDQSVHIWEAITGSNSFIYSGHRGSVNTLAWSPDGTHIASGGSDKTVQIWRDRDGSHPFIYTEHTGKIVALAWSPDGTRIASGSLDKTVRVWHAGQQHQHAAGNKDFVYHGHERFLNTVFTIAWSPDNLYIASAGKDGGVHVWDANTGEPVYTYEGHSSWVYAIAWSPDRKYLASAGIDKKIVVWEATTGHELIRYHGHKSTVIALAWSPDGRRIVSSNMDGGVLVWYAKH
ncbi:MAG: WD40 repeat domain-containing serine/threonine-protein kinase [Chloroflexota bacterium]|nr:WD40 repeat domain-containing serine/threonine-protein kinase [Chloroflexota bacterium]